MTYYEKLKSPLWQKRRLEIMGRDDFKCVECGDAKSTLSVHHCYYQRGLEPWEYPDSALRTVCDECHTMREEKELIIKQWLAGFSLNELEDFYSVLSHQVSFYGPSKVYEVVMRMGEKTKIRRK